MVAQINRIIHNYIWQKFKVIAFLLCLLTPSESNGLTLISDAETQNYLTQVIKPLYSAAGISFDENKIFIVNDNSLNAFVSDGNYLFVHTGTLISADNSNELSGILAHETGHILGGHIARMKLKLNDMQYVMLGSMIMAGAVAGASGRADAAMGVLLGSQSSSLSNMLNHQMQEERSADESAVKLLAKTKQSTKGLQRFMRKIKRQNTLSGIDENLYFRTHPLTNERIAHFEEAAKNNHFPESSKLDKNFAFVKAKLCAFLENPDIVKRKYPQKSHTPESTYANAILYFRNAEVDLALKNINALIKQFPDNPYFYELKGQFLFETGKVKESISPYRKALKLLPLSAQLKLSLAQALLESSDDNQTTDEAITLLNQAQIDVPSALGWQLLARAYAKNNKMSESYYATAEFNYAIGNRGGALKALDKIKNVSQLSSQLRLKISDLRERINTDKR